MKRIFAAAIFACFSAVSLNAMIVYGKDNDSTKVVYDGSASAGAYSVVNVAGCSAVYLGNGWFLTANHVGVTTSSSVSQNGQSAAVDYVYPSFSSDHSGVDLKLFYSGNAEASLEYLTAAALDANISSYATRYSTDLNFVSGGVGRAADSSPTDAVVPWGDLSTMAIRSQSDRFDASYSNSGIRYFANYAEASEGSLGAADRDSGGGVFLAYQDTAYLVATIIGTTQVDETVFASGSDSESDAASATASISVNLLDYVDDIKAVIATTPVPEPAALASLMAGACLAIVLFARRK